MAKTPSFSDEIQKFTKYLQSSENEDAKRQLLFPLFSKLFGANFKTESEAAGGAGWHISKELELPENIRLLKLPPYAPELNPTEHIWDYIREQKHFNNYTFETLDKVEENLSKTLKKLNTEHETLISLCNFSWLKNLTC